MSLEQELAPFDYDLPDACVAVYPLSERSDSKLMVLGSDSNDVLDSKMSQIIDRFNPGDVLVLNNTKVLHARVQAKRVTGGKVEVFFLHGTPESDECYLALVKPSRRLKEGEQLLIDGMDASISLVERQEDGQWRIRTSVPASQVMDFVGHVPIPPYLKRESETFDQERYQTVFATESGAVAAPTAGLHFTPSLLSEIENKGVQIRFVTLHVGIGTFRNLREEDLRQNKLHSEWYSVPIDTLLAIQECKGNGGAVFACGTTVTRTLESAWLQSPSAFDSNNDNPLNLRDIFPISGYTNIFIREGFTFQIVDGLLTNFHLPKSSLLMLVSAFAGREKVLKAYRYAVANGYRFFSYGDAMLITPQR